MIAKMYMVAQINYVGCFLEPTEEWTVRVQDVIDTFITGTFKIAKSRKYLSAEEGGLGLLNV